MMRRSTLSSRHRRNQAGGMKLGTLIFLLLVGGGVYTAFAYIPPWMAYRAIRDQMVEQAREAAVVRDEEIVDRIVIVANSWEVPLTEEDIVLTRSDGRLSMATEWDITIHHFGVYDHQLHFAPAVDEFIVRVAR